MSLKMIVHFRFFTGFLLLEKKGMFALLPLHLMKNG